MPEPLDREVERILNRMVRRYFKSIKERKEVTEEEILEVKSLHEFYDVINSRRIVVAIFTSPYCSACRVYKPEYQTVARELKGKVTFVEVDVSENYDIAQEYDIRATPTTLIFYHGRPTRMILGAVSANMLRREIEKVMKQSSY